MGMIARYIETNSTRLNQLLTVNWEARRAEVHGLVSGSPNMDIDKFWDSLHFILTGSSALKSCGNSPQSRIVVGSHVIDKETYIAVTYQHELEAIINLMRSMDRNVLRAKYSLQRMNEEDVYPDKWPLHLEEQLFDSLMYRLYGMANFYQRCLTNGNHLIITIVG